MNGLSETNRQLHFVRPDLGAEFPVIEAELGAEDVRARVDRPRVCHLRSGSNVIMRRAHPGLAGRRPHKCSRMRFRRMPCGVDRRRQSPVDRPRVCHLVQAHWLRKFWRKCVHKNQRNERYVFNTSICLFDPSRGNAILCRSPACGNAILCRSPACLSTGAGAPRLQMFKTS